MKFFDNLESWFNHSAFPALKLFLGGVVHDEVAAATPIVQATVAKLTVEEATALATGNSANTGHILAAVVRDASAQLKAASISVGSNSLLTAVGAAAANAPALVAAHVGG